MQNRWKSKFVWLGLGGTIIMFMQSIGLIDVDLSTALTNLINGVCLFLVGVGVLNNPTDGENW